MSSVIETGMSVRADYGLGIVLSVSHERAIIRFARETILVPVNRLRVNAEASLPGPTIRDALKIYSVLALRLERGVTLSPEEQEAFQAAKWTLEIAEPAVDPYAERQRDIRAAQPKVSSAHAHERAHRALAAAQPNIDE